jgi:hypothetical protein
MDAFTEQSVAFAERRRRQAAVDRAKAVDDLRAGNTTSAAPGGEAVQRLGSHAYYLVEGAWTRDDYEAGIDTPEVTVGSAEFLALIGQSQEIAEAAALGERVITLGPDGWVTLVWPEVEAGRPQSSGRGGHDPTRVRGSSRRPRRRVGRRRGSVGRRRGQRGSPAGPFGRQYGSGMKFCSSSGGRT